MTSLLSRLKIYIILTCGFLLWIWSFRGYIFNEFGLVSDAVSYYDHIKFYIDNIAKGIFPLWDPYWNNGSPNEFFLRRIGPYNPFLFSIILFNKLGIPYTNAYLLFLSLYYFVGMLGYYQLVKQVSKDKRLAVLAYFLLMFSSLGTLNFSSFLLLIFVPMVWFFFFFFRFIEQYDRISALGMTFCLMLIVTTYIPFYFLTIFFLFLILVMIFYFKDANIVLKKIIIFVIKNKGLFFLCTVFVICALIPGINFMRAAKSSEFDLPERSFNSAIVNAVAVGKQSVVQGGIVSPTIFSRLFGGYAQMKLGVLYIPPLVYLFFILGLLTRVKKRQVMIFLWGGLSALMGLYDATPFYGFLKQYIFYFNYFRNFQFFIWIFLLPLFIYLSLDHLKSFLEAVGNWKPRWINGKSSRWHIPLFILVFTGGIIHPLTVYDFLRKNAVITNLYDYDRRGTAFDFSNKDKFILKNFRFDRIDEGSDKNSRLSNYTPMSFYYAVKNYRFLLQNSDNQALKQYLRYKFVFYDQVKFHKNDDIDLKELTLAFEENKNIAFAVLKNNEKDILNFNTAEKADYILEGRLDFKVKGYTSNKVHIQTNLSQAKFLVYNDNFYSDWKAFIDGRESPIYRSNYSFKGVWIPEGAHDIVFRFGQPIWLAYNYFLIVLFMFVFGWLIQQVILTKKEATVEQ